MCYNIVRKDDTMKFNIRGSKLEVTQPIKNYIEEKIGRLDKYFESPETIKANVIIRISGIDQIIEMYDMI